MWLPSLFGPRRATSARARAPRRRSASCWPSVERLEDRRLLAALLLDINPLRLGSSHMGLTNVNGTLLFTARTTGDDGCTAAPDRYFLNYDVAEGFQSRHPGGASFAFVDGSVRFLNQTINHPTYQYLGCRDDGQVVSLP